MYRMLYPVLIATMSLMLSTVLPVQAEEFAEGRDYVTLKTPIPVRDKSKVEVLELFWYGCPTCNYVYPFVTAWKKKQPADVDFWHSPAAFRNTDSDPWKVHARAFFAAEALGISEQMHRPLFQALAVERRKLTGEKSLAKFFAEHGVKEEDFKKAYNSFGVKSKAGQAVKRTANYQVSGVPTLVVNGKYRIVNNRPFDVNRMLRVVDYLVEKERQYLGG